MEKFILFNVDKAAINIEDFGLPADFDKFRKATKTVSKKDEFKMCSLIVEPDFWNNSAIWSMVSHTVSSSSRVLNPGFPVLK